MRIVTKRKCVYSIFFFCITLSGFAQPLKWYPGHYIFTAKRSDLPGVLKDVQDRPIVRGFQISYFWDELEPTKDDYSFEAIYEDLELLNQNGKKLIIQVQYKSFAKNDPHVPEYLRTEEYEGGVYQGRTGSNWNICLWNDQVQERLTKLLQELGKQFDSNPSLVAINLPETALTDPFDDSPFYANREDLRTIFLARLNDYNVLMREIFPRTPFVQYFNSGTAAINEHRKLALEHGIGIGGPDTWLGAYKYDAWSKYAYDYTQEMAGMVPLLHSVQWPNYHSQTQKGKNNNPVLHPHVNIKNPVPDIFHFNRDTLKSNFISWVKRNQLPDSTATKTYWALVLDLLDSLAVAYPDDPAGSMESEIPSLLNSDIFISETEYQDLLHYKVETPSATFYISKESGGCTSFIDRDGWDWINSSRTGENPPYNSADSDYRGMPNLVFRGDDDGVGHPSGIGKCNTTQVAYNKLTVNSISGKWKFTWTFHPDHAVVEVLKTDTTRNYWFLYEGPVAGKFSPSTHYWATDTKEPTREMPLNGKTPANGNWQWAYFGDDSINRCLYVSMTDKDEFNDFFAYMGNLNSAGLDSPDGMNVFGFGRQAAKPLMKGNNKFIVGFYEDSLTNNTVYQIFKSFIDNLNSKYATPSTIEQEYVELAAYWSFDTISSDNFTDLSETNSHLTISGTILNETGKSGNAASFDKLSESFLFRSDNQLHYSFPGASEGLPADSFSIACWIRLNSIDDRSPIIVKEENGKRGFEFGVKNGFLAAQIFKDETTGSKIEASKSQRLDNDQWYHVAMMYDYISDGNSELKFFLNGEEYYANNEIAGPLKVNTAPVWVGAYVWGDYERYFNGLIDELYVYNKKMSSEEIQELITGSPPSIHLSNEMVDRGFKAYPNPAGSIIQFEFFLPDDEHVNIKILGIDGRQICVLLDKKMCPGFHMEKMSLKEYDDGIYIAMLSAGEKQEALSFIKGKN